MDPTARRGLRLFGASFGLAWVTISMTAGPGPAAWVRLSGRLEDAGLYFALYALAAAAGALLGGRLMDRLGRRRVLVGAHLTAAAGFAVAGAAVAAARLDVFAAGVVVLAAGFGTILLTRVAAADLVPAASRGRAVAVIQVSALFGAVVGPLLLVLAGPLGGFLGQDPRGFVWALAPPVLLVSALVASRAPESLAAATAGPAAAPAPIPRRPLLVGIAALALAEAAMVGIMAVAGPALDHAGHGVESLGIVMAAHFVGMFGLSLVVGRVADRVGRRVTILAGLAVLSLGGLVVALAPGVLGFAAGLLLIGLGWSFAYVGGTVVVTDVVPAARRARVVGAIDLGGRLLAAAASASAGLWFASRGLPGLGFAAAALVLVPLVLALSLPERAPGAYEVATPPVAPVPRP